jgi:hypothetical protein
MRVEGVASPPSAEEIGKRVQEECAALASMEADLRTLQARVRVEARSGHDDKRLKAIERELVLLSREVSDLWNRQAELARWSAAVSQSRPKAPAAAKVVVASRKVAARETNAD